MGGGLQTFSFTVTLVTRSTHADISLVANAEVGLNAFGGPKQAGCVLVSCAKRKRS